MTLPVAADPVRRRKWSVLLITLLVVAAAVGASLAQTPVYEAAAEAYRSLRMSVQFLGLDRTVKIIQSRLGGLDDVAGGDNGRCPRCPRCPHLYMQPCMIRCAGGQDDPDP